MTAPSNPTSDVWYANGLRFQCTQCGNCCTGEPGYVWVDDDEIEALRESVNAPDAVTFREKYVRNILNRKSLREFDNGDCIFFDPQARNCTVYDARPRQCRTWPFWDSNLATPESWQRTCEACPGSGTGQLYDLDFIETRRKSMSL